MPELILHFVSPPTPFFIENGVHTFLPGESHASRQSIDVFNIIIVSKGKLSIGENQQTWTLHKDEAVILRPDAHHFSTAPCEEETEINWVHFQTAGAWSEMSSIHECLEHQAELFQQHRQQAHLCHCEICSFFLPKKIKLSRKSISDLAELYALDKEPCTLRNWKKQTAFQLFMQSLTQDSTPSTSLTAIHLAEKIEAFITQNFTSKITNSVLQEKFNYHPNYLAKCMLKVYGVTPIDYLMHYRIEEAKRLLLQTDWSIARIADEVGFSNPGYFSSVFAQKQYDSPSTFRKKGNMEK